MTAQIFEKVDVWSVQHGKSVYFTIGRLCKTEADVRGHVFIAKKTGGIPEDVVAGFEFQRAIESAR